MKPVWRLGLVALVGLLGTMAFGPPRAAAGTTDTYRTDVELSTRDINSKQVALGDLIADAIRAATHADAAFIAAASFSDDDMMIKPGAFTVADVLKALEYKNENIAIVKLTGTQIRDALEHGLYLYPKANSSFLQTSGLTVTVNPDGDGDRHITAIKINGEALAPAKTYHVAMPMTLANGALAYFKYWKKSDIEKDTGKTLESALTAYLIDHKTIAKGEDRLVARGK